MPCTIKNPANIDLSSLEPHVNGMYDHFAQKYGFKKPPVMVFDSDPSNRTNVLGKTAYYDPSSLEIHVYTDGRHPKDMLRSIAHELIHHRQNLEGRLNVGGYQGEGYYLKNKELKKLEQEAMKDGNETLREYEDGLKLKRNEKMSLKEWKNNELNKLLMKRFGILKEEKEITHMCALEVTHKASGQKGHPIKHTLTESGDISHYTVEFQNVIVENIAVENLEIVKQEVHSHKRDDEKDHDEEKPVVEESELEELAAREEQADDRLQSGEATGREQGRLREEELDEAAKPDFPDVDGDGDREEPISKAQQDKKEKEGDSEDKEESDDDKDLSKVPPQLRKHVKGKMKQESIEEIVKENRKLRLRIK
tara:strand:+ start:1638 stop:2732 length:1095 start_codon:yes stop_codon:yes gene_type:complete